MRSLRTRVVSLAVCALLVAGGAVEVLAQRYRVRVYNPGRYARTRQTMSNRVALKKKKKRKAVRAHHTNSRRTTH